MNDYESRRQERIARNKALLAELDVKPLVARSNNAHHVDGRPTAKRRKIVKDSAPLRTSSRIAAAPTKPNYQDEPSIKAIPLPRSTKKVASVKQLGSIIKEADEPLVPVKDVDEIQAGWTAWTAVAEEPVRTADGKFHFGDYPDFTPNKSPEEMLREGCFGGQYYRPVRSRKLGIVIQNDWTELPSSWIEGLNAETHLINLEYDTDINKFKVACGQSIEEWEAAGWISHEHDVRGWFQWYTRFYRGRRCDDDDRQVSRWKKCVGETGRWRRMLLKKYLQLGVRDVFDDGADEDAPEVSPVMHQTCHHWAYEVRQGDLDDAWAGR
ncbi:hypothetical protein AMS68_003312 [Peltaster fructicola]|uniref:Vegetatible incompatibility protein HET-E-1 n=1 Tax=Peltaster fructicola TaxID=286661 RepID=A0A6H0XT24_9PEZI|nr:hypothetical protein AMS68_003312 [Peltaster fructicola]